MDEGGGRGGGMEVGVGGVCGCTDWCVGVDTVEEGKLASSSLMRTSRARHFLSSRLHRSHESAAGDHEHCTVSEAGTRDGDGDGQGGRLCGLVPFGGQ
jgi:hypothetical protein